MAKSGFPASNQLYTASNRVPSEVCRGVLRKHVSRFVFFAFRSFMNLRCLPEVVPWSLAIRARAERSATQTSIHYRRLSTNAVH